MWEARAEYKDGTSVERYFETSESLSENEDQYMIECWLLERHPGCTWYPVSWVNDIAE